MDLGDIFGSLADPTRRDILKRLTKQELTINELARPYNLTLAAVSKHIQVLERAGLISKRRDGNHQYVTLSPPALKDASDYLDQYRALWEERFERLDELLEKEKVALLKNKNKKYGKK